MVTVVKASWGGSFLYAIFPFAFFNKNKKITTEKLRKSAKSASEYTVKT
jgi:hypothetical protein